MTLADNVVSKVAVWSGIKTIARVESERTHNGKTSFEQRYYICSKVLSAEAILHVSLNHWGVESMHWIIDVGFNEDANRTRKGHTAENLAVMRQLTLNVLRQDKETKLSINNKHFKACNDLDYLNKLVTSLEV